MCRRIPLQYYFSSSSSGWRSTGVMAQLSPYLSPERSPRPGAKYSATSVSSRLANSLACASDRRPHWLRQPGFRVQTRHRPPQGRSRDRPSRAPREHRRRPRHPRRSRLPAGNATQTVGKPTDARVAVRRESGRAERTDRLWSYEWKPAPIRDSVSYRPLITWRSASSVVPR